MSKSTSIILMAFGKRGYYFAAYNIAFSIKEFGCNTPIHLVVDSIANLTKNIGHGVNVFDSIIEMEPQHLRSGDPAWSKLHLHHYITTDNALYLDVDAVAVKDITPLITLLQESNKPYIAHTVGYHTLKEGNDIQSMQWAWANDLWAHFGLAEEAILPAINSSLVWISKVGAEPIYKKALEFYQNPLPKLRMKWGGGQPDELYMNAALAALGIDPSFDGKGNDDKEGMIHFGMKRTLTTLEVREKFYLQSYFGGKGFTNKFYTDWCDKILRDLHATKGINHNYTLDKIIQDKHANKR
jgi:hypothetical protein